MKKILYIEDEADQVATVQEFLEERGYKVISAKDGDEGLKLTYKEKPDLILLDHFLPKIKGFDVCKHLKEDSKTKGIPIIIITASGVDYLDEQIKTIDANDYVRKPYGMMDLFAKVKVQLGEIK